MIDYRFKFLYIPFYLFCLYTITGCEKKIIEIVPVIEIEDISIPGAKDIKHFSFPTSSIGYAASDTNFIYKTIDGGLSWIPINMGLNIRNKCGGIEFFNEKSGMCLMSGGVYVTSDGGNTWSLNASADFIGISKLGNGILGLNRGRGICSVYETDDMGESFLPKGSIPFDMYLYKGRVTENKCFAFGSNIFYDDAVYGTDLETNSQIEVRYSNLTYDENPNDIYYYNGIYYSVGKKGTISENATRNFWGHVYDFYSIDGYNGLAVAVGDNTIVSNMDIGSDNTWNEIFDIKGNGFSHSFYRIRFKDANTFYVSGNKGLIWRATL